MGYDICIIGGFGHVGLPLALTFANNGLNVCAFDISKTTLEKLNKGEMPFTEDGAEPLLRKNLKKSEIIFKSRSQFHSRKQNCDSHYRHPNNLTL